MILKKCQLSKDFRFITKIVIRELVEINEIIDSSKAAKLRL